MVKLTIDVIEQSTSFLNACRERELDLRDNKIPAIENLGVTRDQNDVLDLTNNDIIRLENFPFMPRLRTLLLSNNRMTRVDPQLGQFLPNLESLVLANNNLTEFSALEGVVGLKSLKYLVLMGNPLAEVKNYRLFCVHSMPQLKYLDYSHIKQTERDEAKQLFESVEGKQMLSKTFTIGQLPQGQKKLSNEEIERIKTAIKNAKTLEEVTLLERQLRQGRV